MNREEGVTLIEVVISMTILALILIAFFPFLVTSLKTAENNRYRNEGMALAMAQVNHAREYVEAERISCQEINETINPDQLVTIIDSTEKVEITTAILENCGRGMADYVVTAKPKNEDEEGKTVTVNAVIEIPEG